MIKSLHRRSYTRDIVLIICIVAITGIASYSLFGAGGFRDLQKAWQELQERQVRVNDLENEIKLRTQNADAIDDEALKSGHPETLELLERRAREQGYAREGEFIQRIPD